MESLKFYCVKIISYYPKNPGVKKIFTPVDSQIHGAINIKLVEGPISLIIA